MTKAGQAAVKVNKAKGTQIPVIYFIIQLHLLEYKQRLKRVQISRGICTPEDWLDRFPAVDQSGSWISRAKFVPLRILLSRIPCKIGSLRNHDGDAEENVD